MKKKTVYQGFFSLDIIETSAGTREVLRTTDSVSILIYDSVNRRIVLVRQSRAAMMTDENPQGLITETVAGRIDKQWKLEDIIIDEVLKESGISITKDDIIMLNHGKPMALSAGAITELCYLACAVITPDQMEAEDRVYGDPEEGEQTTRVFVSVDELDTYMCEDMCAFALIQFLQRFLADGKGSK
ncbi:MAG: hypothetical protein Q8R40_03580 [bacterium]|nr:hypothetical protein [bacterium]